MTHEERRAALKQVDPSHFGIYEAEVKNFLQYFEDMERVKELGGLHVLGSERHEARRIDNQLRGRAARQGDPGSSRFYLSLEDDLMRIAGRGASQRLDGTPQSGRLASAGSGLGQQASSNSHSTALKARTSTSASICWNTMMCSTNNANRSTVSATASSTKKT
jgi:hypothetical protein